MLAKALQSAAKSVEPVFIEDTFAVHLYTGNGSTQTITNGIDLSGKGGLTWIKSRNDTYDHYLYDTLRGATKSLQSDTTTAEQTYSDSLTAFNSNGFALGANVRVNANTTTYVSWTFRKQAKFFDVVTWTSSTSTNQRVSHSLESAPGVILIKRVNGSQSWYCYHQSLGRSQYLVLNGTNAASTSTNFWGTSDPTATDFGINAQDWLFPSETYVAYLFAHDAGGFGASGSDNVITCGSYTGNGSTTGPTVTLGYEPQWVMVKSSTLAGTNWIVLDSMRGMTDSASSALFPNLANAEAANNSNYAFAPLATGFQIRQAFSGTNNSGETYIYIAIRRGPMKTPTTGTSVFSPVARTGNGAATTLTSATFPVDLFINKDRAAVFDGNNEFFTRLQGATQYLISNTTGAEATDNQSVTSFAAMSGVVIGTGANGRVNQNTVTYIDYNLRRAPGFFDVVCFTQTTTTAAQTISHNLTVTPELVIAKTRSAASDWQAFPIALNNRLNLNTTLAASTYAPLSSVTSTSFSYPMADLGVSIGTTFVAYLFASCPGVSKVGSYTGTGNTLQIDCGFTGGARFVLIKRTDSTGDWYVWDSARGIVAGNDPYLLLNSTAAEVTTTDWVDTYSAGFELSNAGGNNANINTATYIFLAIA